MELTQLKQFKTVAECENFTEAGNLLFVSQQALSKSINNLETELGIKLFDRVGKRVKLNDAGRAVLGYVLQMTNLEEQILKEAENIKGCSKITFMSPIAPLIMYTVPVFETEHREINVSYQLCENNKPLDALLYQKCDVIFTYEVLESSKIECIEICNDYSGINVSRKSPLAKFDNISLKELRGQNFATYENNNPLLVMTREKIEKTLGIKFTYHGTMAGLKIYADSIGAVTIYSTLSEEYIKLPSEQKFIPFDKKENIFMTYYMCFLKDNPKKKNIMKFADWMRESLQEYNKNTKSVR